MIFFFASPRNSAEGLGSTTMTGPIFRGLAAPQHELERRIIMFAGFQREIEQSLALRGAGFRTGKDHRMAEHDGAVFMPEIEMPDPQPRIHIHQQVRDILAAHIFGHPHVEGRSDVQRFQVVAPGEAEMMVAPFARDGKVEFVPAGTLERPAIIFHRPLQHIDGMRCQGELVLMNYCHARGSSHKTKQLRTKLAQDFAMAQESRTLLHHHG
jgi:hypothetical protein